jgi:hypothetical protein
LRDNDSDGIDDTWEEFHGGSLANDSYDVDTKKRYTNLECFLQELAGDTLYKSESPATLSLISPFSQSAPDGERLIEIYYIQGRRIRSIYMSDAITKLNISSNKVPKNFRQAFNVYIVKVRRHGRPPMTKTFFE